MWIQRQTGQMRTRKQVSSHIQVIGRKRKRDPRKPYDGQASSRTRTELQSDDDDDDDDDISEPIVATAARGGGSTVATSRGGSAVATGSRGGGGGMVGAAHRKKERMVRVGLSCTEFTLCSAPSNRTHLARFAPWGCFGCLWLCATAVKAVRCWGLTLPRLYPAAHTPQYVPHPLTMTYFAAYRRDGETGHTHNIVLLDQGDDFTDPELLDLTQVIETRPPFFFFGLEQYTRGA